MSWILGCIPELPFFTQSLTSSVWVQPCVSWGHTSVQAPSAAQAGPQQFNKYWLMAVETVSFFLDRLSPCLQEIADSLSYSEQLPWQQKLNTSKLEATQKSQDNIAQNPASLMTFCIVSTQRTGWESSICLHGEQQNSRPDLASHGITVFQSEAEAKLLILAVEDSKAHSLFSGSSLSIKGGELSWTPWSHAGKKMSRFLYVPFQG